MISALECISEVQKILPEARLSATHDNQGIKIENGAFGVIRSEDNKYHLNDAGSLLTSPPGSPGGFRWMGFS